MLTEKEIDYVEYTCTIIAKTLRAIQREQKQGYIYASENRAQFNRLRIELNKALLKIKKNIYNN